MFIECEMLSSVLVQQDQCLSCKDSEAGITMDLEGCCPLQEKYNGTNNPVPDKEGLLLIPLHCVKPLLLSLVKVHRLHLHRLHHIKHHR